MPGPDQHLPPLDWLVHLVALVGSIFATSGLVSDDRSRNYYRFLFAKPLDPIRYYAQAFVLRGLVIILIAAFVAGRTLHLAFFSGQKMPVFTPDAIANSTDICGTFLYAR